MSPRRALHEHLEALRTEMRTSASLSGADRARLEELLGEVRRHAEDDSPEEEPNTVAERLREATAHFEESHPKLTMAVGAVAEALSRLGI
jgi:hypothetical protein